MKSWHTNHERRSNVQVNTDYVLALKANHSILHGQIEAWFAQAQALNFKEVIFSYNERVF